MVTLLTLDFLFTLLLQRGWGQDPGTRSEVTRLLGEIRKVLPHLMDNMWGSPRLSMPGLACVPNKPWNALICIQHSFNQVLPVTPGVSNNHLTNPLPSHQAMSFDICWPILCPGITGLSSGVPSNISCVGGHQKVA